MLGVGPVSFDDVIAVARRGAAVAIGAESRRAMATSRSIVDALAVDTSPHYGISTGFGALATTSIAPSRRAALQASLIRSHAAGTGTPVESEVVRAMMLLRLSTLATGRTGIRPATAEALRRAAQRRHHPDRSGIRLAGLLRRSRAVGHRRAGADR